MTGDAFQDHYPEALAHCYGCGRLNADGLHVRSTWDGEETVATITPGPQYVAVPGYVYGGLVASLIDCHGTGSAAGAMARRRVSPPHARTTVDVEGRCQRHPCVPVVS